MLSSVVLPTQVYEVLKTAQANYLGFRWLSNIWNSEITPVLFDGKYLICDLL